jgi:CubicO group peptidase (beta-lactamase class C family)
MNQSIWKYLLGILISIYVFLLTSCSGDGQPVPPTLSATAQTQIDTLVGNFMTTHSIPTGSITVMNGGYVLYSKSYGYQDIGQTTTTVNDPLMLTASIVKPLTAAAIEKLVAAGTLNLSDRAFCTGSNTPCWIHVTDPDGHAIAGAGFNDARYGDITIAHLIAHEGGWDRTATTCANANMFTVINGVSNPTPCDPMIQEYLIQQTLHGMFTSFGATQQPNQMNDIYYWLTQNALDFTPGSAQQYSNFGYMVLATIVAQASGIDFTTYVYKNLLAPLGVVAADFAVYDYSPAANAAQALRRPATQTNLTCKSTDATNNGVSIVANTKSCLNPANWVGVATNVATPKAMAMAAAAYKIDNSSNLDAQIHPSQDGPNNGKPLSGASNNGVHYGDLPGANNIIRQLTSGTSYTLMLGRDSSPGGTWQATLYPQIDAILAADHY